MNFQELKDYYMWVFNPQYNQVRNLSDLEAYIKDHTDKKEYEKFMRNYRW